jgi:hypothetical protein
VATRLTSEQANGDGRPLSPRAASTRAKDRAAMPKPSNAAGRGAKSSGNPMHDLMPAGMISIPSLFGEAW